MTKPAAPPSCLALAPSTCIAAPKREASTRHNLLETMLSAFPALSLLSDITLSLSPFFLNLLSFLPTSFPCPCGSRRMGIAVTGLARSHFCLPPFSSLALWPRLSWPSRYHRCSVWRAPFPPARPCPRLLHAPRPNNFDLVNGKLVVHARGEQLPARRTSTVGCGAGQGGRIRIVAILDRRAG